MKFTRKRPGPSMLGRWWRSSLSALVGFSASYFRSFVALVLLTVVYFAAADSQFRHGGSWVGLIYGFTSLALVIILIYYGIRKRSYSSPIGKLEDWVRSHMSLGVLALFAVLLHSGFRFHDHLAVTAFVLLTVVFLSGIVGALLYANIPPKMMAVESNLSAAEISDKINQVADSMTRLAQTKSAPFQGLCRGLIEAEWPASMAGWRILSPGYRRKHAGRKELRLYEADIKRVEAREEEDLKHLLNLSHQMRDLHDRLIRKQIYVNLMAAWLYVHVPISFLMVAAILVHAVSAFYYW